MAGTLSGIGGPPIALVYQNAHGANLRANLSVLFVIGTIISLVALTLIGRFGLQEIELTVLLLVGIVGGVLCSGPLKTRVDRTTARPYLLGLCVLSACGVLLRAVLMLRGSAIQ